ncbi:MAG: hypothetical protein ACREX9_01635 [Gammaproteobacteria bacterium]
MLTTKVCSSIEGRHHRGPGFDRAVGGARDAAGTIVLAERPVEVPATFNSSGKLKMEFLRLLFRELGRSFRSLAFLRTYGPLSERPIGDLSAGGKGEVLVLLSN